MAQPLEKEHAPPAKRRRRSRITVYGGAAKKAAATTASAVEVTEITLTKARYRRFVARRGFYEKLLANLVDSVETATREGRTAVEVSLEGETPTVKPVASSSPLDGAMARAKARGAGKVADILKGPDMLTSRTFAPLIGVSHETVNVRRQQGEVLGLDGPKRGYKYPRWQVTETGMPLPGLARVFHALGDQPWTVYRFLRTAHAELGGKTALDALKAGQVEAVLGVAENQAAGAFA